MAASDVVVEEFDDLGFTLSDPQIIDRLVSELKRQVLFISGFKFTIYPFTIAQTPSELFLFYKFRLHYVTSIKHQKKKWLVNI